MAITDTKYLGMEINFLVVQRMFLYTASNTVSSHNPNIGILMPGKFSFKHG